MRGLRPDDAGVPRRFRVCDRRRDTTDTLTFSLEPLDAPTSAADEPPFAPGQFAMLTAFGVGEVPISISGGHEPGSALQHTVRDVGGVTHSLVRAPLGSIMGVRGPFGVGWDVQDARGGDLVLVAGGIGLAPLRPALLDVLARRHDYGRVVLLYGARTPQDVLFADELEAWAAEGRVEVQVTVDYAPSWWRGRVGLVTTLVPKAGFDPTSTTALVCGPEVMMRHVAAALVDRGVGAERIRLSLERAMACGVGLCGHCQLRELFVCVDGPVLAYARLDDLLWLREV